ncbi:MAG TPA: DUF4194 domain-containing protein [Candidatus Lustribacter sp.]|nr:DUF4194 domain-containing protein [Candidatus Lustribacter sp.]
MTVSPSRVVVADGRDLSKVVVTLLKGVLYESEQPSLWALLHRYRPQVSDHMSVMGLDLVIDEAEGYAFLRQGTYDDADFPRLVPRHRLSFRVSLLLALLRKRLAEFDASSGDPRLILHRDQVVELLRVHLPDAGNDVRLVADVETLISKVVDLGFLRRMTGQESTVEVRRVLKAYVDAQWLADFDERLRDYLASAAGGGADPDALADRAGRGDRPGRALTGADDG